MNQTRTHARAHARTHTHKYARTHTCTVRKGGGFERERNKKIFTYMRTFSLPRTHNTLTPRTALVTWGQTRLKQLVKRDDLISRVKCVTTFGEIKDLARRELANRYVPR